MTKEELEKEAEEWVISNTEIYDDKFGIEREEEPKAKEAYLAGAEPREKQIQIDAEQIRALQKQNGELTDKVNELEQQIEQMKCCQNCYYDALFDKECNDCVKLKNWKLREIKEK